MDTPMCAAGTADHTASGTRVDARMVFLHSRGPRADKGLLSLDAPGEFYTFNYYDAISVEPVDCPDRPSLLDAYQKTLEPRANDISAFHQVLLAFTDTGGGSGYAREELEAFWGDNREPLFFMSMLHLMEGTAPQALLTRLSTIPLKGRSFVYFTFDHSDLLVFYKGCSFQEYAKYIMAATYSTPRLLTDSITLYSFSCFPQAYTPENCAETFGAYLKIGISNYPKWMAFRDRILGEDSRALHCWLLGRNDVALFHRQANLNWLRNLWTQANAGGESPWYTTYDLSVLIAPDDGSVLKVLDAPGGPAPPDHPKPASGRPAPTGRNGKNRPEVLLKSLYQEFQTVYSHKCAETGAAPDKVWLRWLLDAYGTAEALLESALASDLGVCLVPQFLDFFQFVIPLFQCSDLTLDDVKSIHYRCFSTFFTNISTLIDSTNHSSRQFVQVPSFQSASFEMPPKIMAFYVALGHQLISILRDDDASYGFTISPSFVETLSVYSLGPGSALCASGEQPQPGQFTKQDVKDNEFLSISVDERALYTLNRTMETLAHEFSHFLGARNRCRPVRKRHVLLGVLEEFLTTFLGYFCEALWRDCPAPAQDEAPPKPVGGKTAQQFAQELLSAMEQVEGYCCGPNQTFMMDEVEDLISFLPRIIAKDHALRGIISDFIVKSLFSGPDCPCWKRLQTYLGAELPGGKWPEPSIEASQAQLIEYSACSISMRVLDQYFVHPGEYTNAMTNPAQAEGLCYLYRETFADLQAILLLRMEWDSYDQLLDDKLVPDISIRKLAVARALVQTGYWCAEDLARSGDSPASRLIQYDPSEHHDLIRFSRERINVQLLEHLTQYLTACASTAIKTFAKSKKSAQIEALRATYALVSQRTTVLDLETELMAVISKFRQSMTAGYTAPSPNAKNTQNRAAAPI